MKKRMEYRLGIAKFNEDLNDYEPRPVNKVILVVDGVNEFVQMEKMVATSLEEFRKVWPKEPVTGAPTLDEVNLVVGDMTDEDLASLGLARVSDEAPEQEVVESEESTDEDDGAVLYDSVETAILADAKGIGREQLLIAGGSGEEGAYTADDIRALTE